MGVAKVRIHGALGMAVMPEARDSTCLCLVGIDREGVIVAATGMRDMISAAAQRAVVIGVYNVDH